jgi:pimeloyl-ACP methyl ester carboxylesterase
MRTIPGQRVLKSGAVPPRGGRRIPDAPDRTGGWFKWTGVGVAIGAGAASLVVTSTAGLAAYFARRIVTPINGRDENLSILAVVREGPEQQVVLPANPDTIVEGTYSLYFDGGRGHARIGAIRSYVPRENTVTRAVEAVLSGNLAEAKRGWWSGSVYDTPADIGLAWEDVEVEVPGGTAPAWLIRAEPGLDTWAIMVHGRGATRSEGLRAVRSARELGLTSLLVSYRNDGDAPAADDGRYGLGVTEWVDVEAAIGYALSRGARDVVLFGYSMGGAICLQAADRSRYRHLILALVLDAPVINWVDVLAHQAQLNRIPATVGRYGQLMLSHPLGRRITGLAAPVDLQSMDWVSRAVELRTPTLILHSVDDEFVPYGPALQLAQKNPEMVTFEAFSRAGHTKEWNVEPERWDAVVRGWLGPRLGNYGLPRNPELPE